MSQLAAVPLQANGMEIGLTAILVGFLIVLLLALGAGYWVYKDASKRDNNEVLWAIGVGGITFLFPLFGIGLLVLYIILRGEETATEPVGDGTAGGEW